MPNGGMDMDRLGGCPRHTSRRVSTGGTTFGLRARASFARVYLGRLQLDWIAYALYVFLFAMLPTFTAFARRRALNWRA